MGDTVVKFATTNSCINQDETCIVPKYHFKCRYHEDDTECITGVYTRTKDIMRFPVPRSKIKWNVEYKDYRPQVFTSEKILLKDGKTYKDPDISDLSEYKSINFNAIDMKYDCDRTSHHGPYQYMRFTPEKQVLVPVNPVGRTGLVGRGHLGRWGPNHAADPIVTRWKRDQTGKIDVDPNTNKKILEFVAIQRRDTKEWAIPGGMRDPGEVITKTLVREFVEEALDKEIKFDKFGRIINRADNFEKKLDEFFRNGTQIYKGYVDDPRNTDNAWMETIACNFHDEKGNVVGSFQLHGGDDAEHAQWMELSSNLKLFASHVDFLREVANLRNANW